MPRKAKIILVQISFMSVHIFILCEKTGNMSLTYAFS